MTNVISRPPMAVRQPPPTQARPRLSKSPPGHKVAERIILNAVEGWGKSTFGAFAPNPAFLMSRGETGYTTLQSHNLVPNCDHVELARWPDVLETVDDLLTSDHGAVVLDAMGGFERLCHEHVCNRDFGGDWGEKGFGAFQKGYDVSVAEWLILLQKLDQLRTKRNIPVIILSHSKVRPFKNPMGADFDRYIADCHEKTWGVTHKWADFVFFGTFVSVEKLDTKTKRVKGVGGVDRIIYTERRDAFDAKNRCSLAPMISIPANPKAIYSTIMGAIQGGGAHDTNLPPED